jgi:hypothetical protein
LPAGLHGFEPFILSSLRRCRRSLIRFRLGRLYAAMTGREVEFEGFVFGQARKGASGHGPHGREKTARSAGCLTCRIADCRVGRAPELARSAGWATRDPAERGQAATQGARASGPLCVRERKARQPSPSPAPDRKAKAGEDARAPGHRGNRRGPRRFREILIDKAVCGTGAVFGCAPVQGVRESPAHPRPVRFERLGRASYGWAGADAGKRPLALAVSGGCNLNTARGVAPDQSGR